MLPKKLTLALTTTWAPFSFNGLGLIRGDIIYNSNTNATMKAAITRSIMNGKRSHQELINSQSVIVELNPSSEDMGEIRQSLACLLTSRPDSGVWYERYEADGGRGRGWRNTELGGGVVPGFVCQSQICKSRLKYRGGLWLPVTKRSLHKPKQIQMCTVNGRLAVVLGSCSSRDKSLTLESYRLFSYMNNNSHSATLHFLIRRMHTYASPIFI